MCIHKYIKPYGHVGRGLTVDRRIIHYDLNAGQKVLPATSSRACFLILIVIAKHRTVLIQRSAMHCPGKLLQLL